MIPLFSPSPRAPSGQTAPPVPLPRLRVLRTGVMNHAPPAASASKRLEFFCCKLQQSCNIFFSKAAPGAACMEE